MSDLPAAPFPILTTVAQVRAWRKDAFDKKESVGFVATMGALHQGHLSLGVSKAVTRLVNRSLQACDRTIVSIFVNPAQFAPTEDLTAYPRTLPADIQALSSSDLPGKVSALFLPPVSAMYPSGIQQDVSKQRGTFAEVKGFSHQMEGASRPTFFRGVATVVLKLFNIVQPDQTFFGQKDIQQCFVLRQMVRDLLPPHPPSPDHLVIVPTTRDNKTGLALSSRNAYLTKEEFQFAPTLYSALQQTAQTIKRCTGTISASEAISLGERFIAKSAQAAQPSSIRLELIYINLNSPDTLEPLEEVNKDTPVVISGALWLGKTRMIDNLVVNYELNVKEGMPESEKKQTQHYSQHVEGKKNYHRKTTGHAAATAARHTADSELTLFGSCFCPFVQRTWIALEQAQLPYRYYEVDVYAKPADLLEISPKGLVPALKMSRDHQTRSLHESTVIADFLEETALSKGSSPDDAFLPPASDPYARALVRLQIDHISKAIVPAFYKFLQAQEADARETGRKTYTEALEKLLSLFEDAQKQGLNFGLYGGKKSLSMAEVHVAPWIHRSRVVLSHYRNFEEPKGNYKDWADVLLNHPAVLATTSDDELYIDSYARYAENRPNTSQVGDATNKGSVLP